jgi:hypothetical protein
MAGLTKVAFFLALLAASLGVSASASSSAPPLPANYKEGPATLRCIIENSGKQGVPANVLLGLFSAEGMKNGQILTNTDGSKDLGHFGINTVHWDPDKGLFRDYPEITQHDVAVRGCYNAEIAAWLLKLHLERNTGQDFWTRAANYHSGTPKFNAKYKAKLIPYSVSWGQWLNSRYEGVSISYLD